MKRSSRICLYIVLALGVICAALCRFGGLGAAFIVAAVTATILSFVTALRQQKRDDRAAYVSSSLPGTVFTLVCAALIAVSGIMQLMQGGTVWLVLGGLCLLGAVGTAVAALRQRQGRLASAGCYVPLILFYSLRLFRDFRHWMLDPTISDYCLFLFALIGFMLAVYHLGAFAFGKNGIRAVTFFAQIGCFFGLSAAASAQSAADALLYLSSALLMASYLLRLRRAEETAE